MASRVVHDPAELVQQAAGASLIAVDGRMAVGKTTLSRGLAQAVRGTIIQTDWFFESQWGRNTRELVYADILDIEALAVRIRNAQKRGPIILDGICVLDVLGRVGVTADLHVLVTVALPGDARFRCGVDPAMEGRAGPSGVNDAALLDDDLTLEQLMAELRKEWGPYDLITERSVASYFKVFRPHRNADTIYLRK